jgi:hypothetical protein
MLRVRFSALELTQLRGIDSLITQNFTSLYTHISEYK